jgi:FAD synthetase
VLLHLLAAVLRRRTLEGIGYGQIGDQEDNVAADGAVVSPSHSNATLRPEPSPLKKSTSLPTPPPPIRSVYVLCPSPFISVDEFVEDSVKAYDLRLVRVEGSMRDALQAYLDTNEGAGVEAVLVGTRRNDPHGGEYHNPILWCHELMICAAKLDFLQHCDPGWPQLLRVHPIINWSYGQVWEYLRHPKLQVPYCHLYDEG